MPGFVELLVIIIILISVFGFSRFPAIGEALGRAVHDFRRSSDSRSAIEIEPTDKMNLPSPESISRDGGEAKPD